ncbi:MAG: hypothetical protein EB015_08715 [Methylocystaceae bacterium]|nr:hypothetical protein [Methylocystaceae bacterium]
MMHLYPKLLPDHNCFPYSAITRRTVYQWPAGQGLAVYIALILGHFRMAKAWELIFVLDDNASTDM